MISDVKLLLYILKKFLAPIYLGLDNDIVVKLFSYIWLKI